MKFFRNSFKIFILIVIVVYLVQGQTQIQKCIPKTQLTEFLQGSHTFMLNQLTQPTKNLDNKLQSLSTNQKFVLPFDRKIFGQEIIPQLAYTVHQYDCSEIKEFNYMLLSKITNSGLQFDFISVGMTWNKIKLQFWLNSRIDITLGTYHLENIVFTGDTFQQPINLSVILPQATEPNTIFINMIGGLKFGINTLNYNVQVSKHSANETVYTAEITKSSGSMLLEIIFSYLILNPGLTLYASNGGLMTYPSFGSNTQFIKTSSNFSPIKFFLIGLNGVKMTRENNELKVEFSIDFNGIISAQSLGKISINEITLIYLVIGVSPQKVCQSCGTKKFIDPKNAQVCVQSCPSLTFSKNNLTKGGNICIQCSANIHQALNAQKTGCECQQGYEIDSRSSLCIKNKVPLLSRQQQSQILCNQPNTVPFNGKCVCVQGSYNISGVCTFCKQNQLFDGKKCKLMECSGGNQIRNSQGVCVCVIGFIRNQQNLCVPVCPLFSMPDQSDPSNPSKCQCLPGYYNVSGKCQMCPKTKVYNSATKKCQCRLNQKQNPSTNLCECALGFERNAEGACIKCPTGQYFNGQNCQPINCKANQIIEINQTIGSAKCVCKINFIKYKDRCLQFSPLKGSMIGGFPISVTPGILFDLQVTPILDDLTSKQIAQMFKIQVQPKQAAPKQIVITQFQNFKDRFRVFLNYQNQTPLQVINFKITIQKIPFGKVQIQRVYDVLGSGISSAIGIQRDILK